MTKIAALLVATLTCLAAAPAFADGAWDARHPRRDEVNDRLEHQHDRIRDGRTDGDLSRRQAIRLHREDRAIRRQEQRMASRHDGHLTPREQRALNRRENRVSRQIARDRRAGR